MSTDLDEIFDNFDKHSIFKHKEILQTRYTPQTIPHREDQIKQIASILAPVLRGERPSNLFCYGMTGTGKTLSMHYVRESLLRRAERMQGTPLQIIYINCKMGKVAETEYRIYAQIISQLGEEVPATGLPTQAVRDKFVSLLDSQEQIVVLVLDEIDQLVKKINDDFLYEMSRINTELTKAQIALVGISNDTSFLNEVNPRVKSSLSEEELVFNPYNALQLQEILSHRAAEAFKEGVLVEGVVAKCAAYAARVDGDARRALDLLRVAGELAERDGAEQVNESYIDEANRKIERDKILDVIQSSPRQFKAVLQSIIELHEKQKGESFFTGDVYNHYELFCARHGLDRLTQRRVSDIIQEIDMLGIINVHVISKGRHGRMREIKLVIPHAIVNQAKELTSSGL